MKEENCIWWYSGSRHLGVEVAEYYQEQGRQALWGGAHHQIAELITKLKEEGRFQEIESSIRAMKKEHEIDIPKDLVYVEGKLFEDYIYDMRIMQQFAVLNRRAMIDVILSGMEFERVEEFTTIHNYIDTEAMILRKGSVSAKAGEKLLIPINMRDGSLICVGKGDEADGGDLYKLRRAGYAGRIADGVQEHGRNCRAD